jgi:hypothetical protein
LLYYFIAHKDIYKQHILAGKSGFILGDSKLSYYALRVICKCPYFILINFGLFKFGRSWLIIGDRFGGFGGGGKKKVSPPITLKV